MMSSKMKEKELVIQQVKPPSFTKSLKNALNIDTSEFCKMNWYYPGGRDAFPGQQRMWTVDRCYPYAEGGQLLVDYVVLPHKMEEAKLKHEFFKERNIKYVALDRGVERIDFDAPSEEEQ